MDTLGQLTNYSLNWRSLRDIVAQYISIEQQVATSMADHPVTVARCQAKIEALRNVAAAMETMESVTAAPVTVRKPSPAARDWDTEAAEREQYADVMAADEADQLAADRAGA